MPLKYFKSMRLQMKRVQMQLASITWPILNDPKLYIYLPEDPPSLAELEKRFSFWEPGISPDQSEYWLNWVLKDLESQLIVGTIQAGVHRESKVATIAYMLGSNFQRKGYAFEAIAALIQFLKNEYQVNQIKAWIDTRNVPSIRLIEKLKFSRVELIEKADHFKGADSDEYVYLLDLVNESYHSLIAT